MPINPLMLALKMAAGTFPFARETITTDVETVEGKAARNISPSQSGSENDWLVRVAVARINSGKRINVVPCMSR